MYLLENESINKASRSKENLSPKVNIFRKWKTWTNLTLNIHTKQVSVIKSQSYWQLLNYINQNIPSTRIMVIPVYGLPAGISYRPCE